LKKPNEIEIVMEAIARKKPESIPIALWTHVGALPFLGVDYEKSCKNGEALAEVNLIFQKKFGLDLLKVTPYFRNICIGWGCKYKWTPGNEWVATVEYSVKKEEDWETLKILDPPKTTLAEDIKAAKIIAREIGDRIPFIWTIPGALFIAGALAGDDLVLAGIRSNSDRLKKALDTITETEIKLGQMILEAGANGVFYTTRPGAQRDLWNHLTRAQVEEFSFKYDMRILESLRGADIRILHVCAGHKREDKPKLLVDMMKEEYFTRFPVNAINWWDRSYFDLSTAKRVYGNKFCLLGGLDQENTLPLGKPSDVQTEVRTAVDAAGPDGFIVGPGCTIRTSTPEANFHAAVNAAHGIR